MNLEQQQAIAMASARRRMAEAEGSYDAGSVTTEVVETLGNVGQSANAVIAGTLDALIGTPIAVGARMAGADPGRVQDEPVRRLMASINLAPPVGEERKGYAASVGKMLGYSTEALAGVGAAGARMAKYAPETLNLAQRILKRFAEPLIKSPGKTVAIEATSATTAGVGGEAAETAFPEGGTSSRVAGEVAGGLAPAATQFTPLGITRRYAGQAAEGVMKQVGDLFPALSETSAFKSVEKYFPETAKSLREKYRPDYVRPAVRQRVEERFKRAARSPEQAAAKLAGPDQAPEIPLTTGERTEDVGLLGMEKAVMESSQELRAVRDTKIRETTERIKQAATEIPGGEGAIADTRAAIEARRGYLVDLMDTRVRIAKEKTEERIADLGPQATREQANTVAMEELEKARSAAHDQMGDLWGRVPDSVKLPTTNSMSKYNSLIRSTPKAQVEDIPAKATEFFGGKKPKFAGEVPLKELQGLRSKLLEEARNARSGPTPSQNRARLASEMADAILKDMQAAKKHVVGEVGKNVRTALDYSLEYYDRFTRGPVGKLLGYEATGAPRVEPSLMLEQKGGFRGPVGRVQFDALMKSVDYMEGVPSGQEAMRGAVTDYLKGIFTRSAIENNAVNQSKAKAFMRDYDEIFTRMPEVKAEFEKTIQQGKITDILKQRQSKTLDNLGKPETSYSAVFLGKEPGGEIARVLKEPNVKAASEELLRQVRKDSSGKALRGLRAGVVNHLLDNALVSPKGVEGEAYYSGRTLMDKLNESKMMELAQTVLTPPQLARLKIIAQKAVSKERGILAKPDQEGIIKTTPSEILEKGFRILVVHITNRISRMTGGGGTVQIPGMASDSAKEFIRSKHLDPAKRLIVDAVTADDAKLYNDLLTSVTTTAEKSKAKVASEKRLNAWLAGVIAEAGGEEKTE